MYQWNFFVFNACDVNDSYWTVYVEMNVWERRDNYGRETEKRHLRDVRDGATPSRSVVAARESLSGVFRGSLEAYSPGACSQVSGRSDILIRVKSVPTALLIEPHHHYQPTRWATTWSSLIITLCTEQVSWSLNPWSVFSWQARIKAFTTTHNTSVRSSFTCILWVTCESYKTSVSQALSWKHDVNVARGIDVYRLRRDLWTSRWLFALSKPTAHGGRYLTW